MSYTSGTIAEDPAYENVLPPNFINGYSSAAYQIEGGAAEGGRGPSIWDKHLHEANKDHGDVACDTYHLWQQDIDLLKQYKAKGYRFSVSWSRIIPKGGRNDPINEEGIKYYDDLINALLAANIEPTITLLHFDVPLGIHERYNSFLAMDPRELIADFTFFSKLCFERFGDRVKKWLTFNENSEWVEPLNDTPEAIREAKLSIERTFGWFADPIFLGTQTSSWYHYGEEFPRLSDSELASLKGSADFFSLNHYGTTYATGHPVQPNGDPRFNMDDVDKVWEKDGVKIGKRGEEGHPHIVPWGFKKLLVYIWETYCKSQNIPIVISECGFSVEHEQHMSLEKIVDDKDRQEYLSLYIKALCDASKENGVLVTGFYAWSLLDNLEWLSGYGPRFGVTHIDRENGCKRTPKDSTKLLAAIWKHTTKEI
ncbi:hypothetical protein FVER53590_14160 [Fusarium verticillioides]|nr:hypothetical protein FVER53590_14160 [Fusarium verticillioides]